MHRSHLRALLPLTLLLVAAVAGVPSAFAAGTPRTFADPAVWSPKLGYVLTTGSVRSVLADRLRLSASAEQKLRAIGYELAKEQAKIQRRSDVFVMGDAMSLEEKQRVIAQTGYNESLAAAEQSATVRAAGVLGMSTPDLKSAVDAVWQDDAGTHNLEAALTDMGVSASAIVGAFHVYATRFYDEYTNTFGVALPDKYVKFASNDTQYAAGYPDGTYAVSLYWDGVHHGRDNNQNATYTTPKSVASAKVVDVGPWNTDDNYWNSYSDPVRPRRINNTGISYHAKATGGGGPDFLANKPHLAFGLPESQAAYFNYYGRPTPIPAHTTSWENYWDKPRGYGGQWSGADQFGRQVTQPAAIDLTPPCYAAMGMTDNEWIDMVPLWEARLGVTSGPTLTKKPYFVGQDSAVSVTVKNLGSLTGTWQNVSLKPVNGSLAYAPSPTGSFTLAPGATRTFTFTRTMDRRGAYEWQPFATRASATTTISASTVSFSVANRYVERVDGGSRYGTVVAASQGSFPTGAPTVVVATGLDFPDALAGAPLAKAVKGPLLLTQPDTLPDVVSDEIERLKPSRVVILGGTRSVSANVASQIAALAGGEDHVQRIDGGSRWGTAALIAEEMAKTPGTSAKGGRAIIASGRAFPDALAGSALAAAKGWPVLLVEPTSVPASTSAELKSLGTTSTIVLGKGLGTGVTGNVPVPQIIPGANRYDTAARTADLAVSLGAASWTDVCLASGESFPDSLAAGLAAVNEGGVLLTTDPYALSAEPKARLADHRAVTATLLLFGSNRSLSDDVAQGCLSALK